MLLEDYLKNSNNVAIFGHVRPDGDCVGSALALYNYICENIPGINCNVYLEEFSQSFQILNGTKNVKFSCDNSEVFDTVILVDTPTPSRVGINGNSFLKTANFTINIDHHISNPLNLCHENFVNSKASSACEVLYELLNPNKISKEVANCLYLGIVHDTGAFKFSNTSKRTMEIVGNLIEKGAEFSRIINDTYYTRSYSQTLATGYVLEQAKLALNGKVVYSYMPKEKMEELKLTPVDLANVIDSLREVSHTEVAIFLYPVNENYKISLRSNYIVDVNKIAKEFNGGGHIRAAGGDTNLEPEVAIHKILDFIKKELNSVTTNTINP